MPIYHNKILFPGTTFNLEAVLKRQCRVKNTKLVNENTKLVDFQKIASKCLFNINQHIVLFVLKFI